MKENAGLDRQYECLVEAGRRALGTEALFLQSKEKLIEGGTDTNIIAEDRKGQQISVTSRGSENGVVTQTMSLAGPTDVIATGEKGLQVRASEQLQKFNRAADDCRKLPTSRP